MIYPLEDDFQGRETSGFCVVLIFTNVKITVRSKRQKKRAETKFRSRMDDTKTQGKPVCWLICPPGSIWFSSVSNFLFSPSSLTTVNRSIDRGEKLMFLLLRDRSLEQRVLLSCLLQEILFRFSLHSFRWPFPRWFTREYQSALLSTYMLLGMWWTVLEQTMPLTMDYFLVCLLFACLVRRLKKQQHLNQSKDRCQVRFRAREKTPISARYQEKQIGVEDRIFIDLALWVLHMP